MTIKNQIFNRHSLPLSVRKMCVPANCLKILAGTIPWSGFPLRCLLHEGAHQLARRRCAYGSFTPGDVL